MPEAYEQIKREYGSASSLLLDTVERVTRLEAVDKAAEGQRLEILSTLRDIQKDLRRANLDLIARDVLELRQKFEDNAQVKDIETRLKKVEDTLSRAKGNVETGVAAVRAAWAFIGLVVGAIVTYIAKHWGG